MSTDHITIEEAEVVVVGAGPAGAAAALTLRQLGREVVIVDQHSFPRDKACGDGLWTGAVEVLRELGLETMIDGAQPIEKTRIVRAQAERPFERTMARRGQQTRPRCIPRRQLDAALVDAAINSGVRFVQGRAQEIVEHHGTVTAIVVRREDGSRGAVRGRVFIAADGATSRLRRLVGVSPPNTADRAYAIRQYVRTRNPVEPVFEIRIPVNFRQRWLPGYSWVFPVAEDVANIGVGYFGNPGAPAGERISMRALIQSFAEELRSGPGQRFGDFEEMSPVQGAPLSIGYSADAAQRGNLYFVGDAARLTDPLIGEGISAALQSGRLAADEVDGWLKRGHSSGFGACLARRYPRVIQDTRIVRRRIDRLFADTGPIRFGMTAARQGNALLDDVTAVLAHGADDPPTLDDSPVVRRVAAHNADLRREFVALNNLALEAFAVEFPMAFDMLHRQFRSAAGPTVAASLLLTSAATGDGPNEKSHSAALAHETMLIASPFLNRIGDLAEADQMSLGNGLATFLADYALSYCLEKVVLLGSAETACFAGLTRTVIAGAMSEAVETWRTDRAPASYLAAADKQSGLPHAFAVGLGARLAGSDADQDHLDDFGRNLGVALSIANGAFELFQGDEPLAREPGDQLRAGDYTLPTIFALEADPALAPLLAPETIDDAVDEALARIRATDATERSLAECTRFADAARAALERAGLGGTPLESLIDLAVERHESCLTDQSGGSADSAPDVI